MTISTLTLMLLLSSCAQTTPKRNTKGGVANIINNHLNDNQTREMPRIPASNGDNSTSEESNDEVAAEESSDVSKTSAINIVENEEVNKWIQYFTVRDRERFQRMLNRGESLREVVQNILAENGLPKELYYLGLIESGYVNHARSHANAVGVWQFIRGTGKRYGLSINNYVDERQDPIRATEAAARYLHGLFNVFQSWELVMAAYNCGEYRVLGSVMRHGERNYWNLVNKGILPKETRDYVPKFMAAAIIGLDPEKYGFKVEIEEGKDYPDLELVDVPSPVSLSRVSQTTGVSLDVIKRFNPHLKKGITPPGRARYELWLPQATAGQYAAILAQLTPERGNYKVVQEAPAARGKNVAETESEDPQFHVVKRGENLARIAAKYNQTIAHLKNINNLVSGRIQAGQRLRLTARVYHAPQQRYHVVRKGENLTMLARHYGTTVPRLKQLNRLKRNSIQRGQRLLVSGTGQQQQVATTPVNQSSESATPSVYRVRRGDTLQSIAARFGTTISKLRQANRLRGTSIFVGQSLKINNGDANI